MKIKRKFELPVTTNRRYIIRESLLNGQAECVVCVKQMLAAEQSAALFSLTQRQSISGESR